MLVVRARIASRARDERTTEASFRAMRRWPARRLPIEPKGRRELGASHPWAIAHVGTEETCTEPSAMPAGPIVVKHESRDVRRALR